MKIRLSELYMIFFKISLILIGGGYVLLPISIEEFSKKRNLLTMEEIVDFFTLSQCLPGVIVVKTATFIGYHLRGTSGAAISLLGLITPPFFAILLIAYFLQSSNVQVSSIMDIVNVAVIILVSASFFELAGICLKNAFSIFLFIVTVALFLFSKLPPATIIILLTIFGMLTKFAVKKFSKEVE